MLVKYRGSLYNENELDVSFPARLTERVSIDLLQSNPEEFWKGVEYVEDNALIDGEETIKNLKIPASVRHISPSQLYRLKNLETIEVDENNKSYESKEGSLLTKEGDPELIFLSKNTSRIPDGVIIAHENAIGSTTSLTIPASVRRFFIPNVIVPESLKEAYRPLEERIKNLKEITLLCNDGPHKIEVPSIDHARAVLGRLDLARDFVVLRDKIGEDSIPYIDEMRNRFSTKFMGETRKSVVNNFSMVVESISQYPEDWNKLAADFVKTSGDQKWLDGFFDLCFVLGVFSDDTAEHNEAMKFIEDKILGDYNPEIIRRAHGAAFDNGFRFDSKYARFWRENFDQLKLPFFKNKKYLPPLRYEYLNGIKRAYPNKVISSSQTSNALTAEDVIDFYVKQNHGWFENVTEENRALARMFAVYGHSQEDFDKASGWLSTGKKIKEEGKQNLICKPDIQTQKGAITYELLEKGDPTAAILADIIGSKHEEKLDVLSQTCFGMTSPNSGFVVFKKDDKIVGKSWVWFNEDTKKVCLDEVFVDAQEKDSLIKDSGFADCLSRLKDGLIEGMKENNQQVSYVTIKDSPWSHKENSINEIVGGFSDIIDKREKIRMALAEGIVQSGNLPELSFGGEPEWVKANRTKLERVIE